MINLIVSIFGALLLCGGFYLMYLGFSIPPNPLAFFMGLIAAVFGLILMIFFGSKIDLSKKPSSKPKKVKKPKHPSKTPIKPKKLPIKDKKTSKEAPSPGPRAIKPKPRAKDEPKFGPAPESSIPLKMEPETKKVIKPKKKMEEPEKAQKPTESSPDLTEQPKTTSKKIAPVKKKTAEKKSIVTPPKSAPVKSEEKPRPAPRSVLETTDKNRLKELESHAGEDDEFVKNRLDKLKENYIQNAKDIESLIDERLDSFKGTLDKLKTESTEPSIIWSFEAQDVQDAMKDTIANAQNKILMMYPWVRNIDVGVLKKFMDIESRMIIQEASLDDDASVELIKLLQEKNVKIRTMPHVHTVALVADDANGLIISTDPIYESYEVGVVYKDKKSISEIERMFEDAWSISQDINLELKE
jgi:hypothetical protein